MAGLTKYSEGKFNLESGNSLKRRMGMTECRNEKCKHYNEESKSDRCCDLTDAYDRDLPCDWYEKQPGN